MSSQFGLLKNLYFLQDLVSIIFSRMNPFIVHNIEKYKALHKVHYLSTIEDIEGDYLEFGVFTGSSFCHSIRCFKRLSKYNSKKTSMNFYGFDSFEGFGKLDKEEIHPFYTNFNFETKLYKVQKRVNKISKNLICKLIPGFFEKTLNLEPSYYGIKKSKIIFIDCDTYSSANIAFEFCSKTIQEGTIIVLDDYYSYKGNKKKGVKGAFDNFVNNYKIEVRNILTYGMGGAVYIVSKIN